MPRLIDRSKIYFYLVLLSILLSIHNINLINYINNFFKIQEIILKGDIEENLNQEIINFLNKFYNYNILLINSEELENILNSYNIISEYSVKKEYPSVIKIYLKETNILASFIENNQKIYLGENGKKINKTITNNNLPIIFGKFKIENFINLRRKLIDSGFNINNFDEFYSYNSNRWDLVYNNQILIKLPSNELDFSINLLKKIIEDASLEDVKIIDLRIKNKIIIS